MPPPNNKSITRYSRRTAGSMILGAIGSLLRSFRVNIPQAKIDHIINRVG